MESNKEQKEKNVPEAASAIVARTVLSIPGVASLSEAPPIHNGVFMTNIFGKMDVDIYLDVYYGSNIPEISWNVQVRTKAALHDEAGIDPDHINIHIEGVDFSNECKSD